MDGTTAEKALLSSKCASTNSPKDDRRHLQTKLEELSYLLPPFVVSLLIHGAVVESLVCGLLFFFFSFSTDSPRYVLKLCNGQILIACTQGVAEEWEQWVTDHNKDLPGMSGLLGKPRGCKIDSKTRSIFVICQQIVVTIAKSWQSNQSIPQGKGWEQVNKTMENPIHRIADYQTGVSTRVFS